ncbi:MAG: N-acetylmuramoyl-L-alanine amidase [Lachnospiraceae bacterium]|jgi:N-acetylmuramoyl-L-alanine amidase|nr:N-acetylmuramoyl-L-alanine amidase [Lachnospiraceae bacterium]
MDFLSKIKKKRAVAAVVGVLALLCLFGTFVQMKEVVQTGGGSQKPTIVVDCGHGGIDPGKVGVNGSYEKDINLAIGMFLKEALEKKKCEVIMTRESDTGLYQDTDSNKKIADLRKRVELMNQDNVDLVVSIHQNSFSGASSKGAQVFYQTGSASGEAFAKMLQAQLASSLDSNNHRQAKGNADYYLLKNTKPTAVIVECGFLSNSEEAQKLCDKTYQRQVAWAIAQGTLQYIESLEQTTGRQ